MLLFSNQAKFFREGHLSGHEGVLMSTDVCEGPSKAVMPECEMDLPPAKRRCRTQRPPKHPIFLSHSGEEKAFVEQLFEDLKRMNHLPFFDQDSDSLPKGNKFPSLIFQGAEQCLLAVVVLSRGYMASKWPMMELRSFVQSMKTDNRSLKLFPVFYKLSPDDLSAENVETRWTKEWKKLVQEGKVKADEIALWSDAVRELRACTGVDFKKMGTSEVKYRAAVVEEICRIVPPMMKYKTDDIRGYQRLCEITEEMFEEGMCAENETNICKAGCVYVGIYGMGGVGKSTLCRALCNHFQAEFRGRVCHVELPAGDAMISTQRVEMLRHAVRELAGFDNRIVDMITTETQGLQCFKDRLRGQPPVLLVVDNVGDSSDSRDFARDLVKSVVERGSKVMVTSRSREVLELVLEEAKYCKPIPRLKEDETAELFLSVAAPRRLQSTLQAAEDEILKAYLRECLFTDDGHSSPEYLPLIVRALGAYLHDETKGDILSWKGSLPLLNNLQGSSYMIRVENILGLNYSTLTDIQKAIFLDIAFLLPYSKWRSYWRICDEMEVSLIAALHERTPSDREREVAKREVKVLRRKSLIYSSGPALRMHDLYITFARSLIEKEGSKEWKWWVGRAAGKNAKTLRRLRLDGDMPAIEICRAPKQFWKCEELVCLVLANCFSSVGRSLDVGRLKSLRVLSITECPKLEEVICGGDDSRSDVSFSCVGGCIPELQTVNFRWNGELRRIPFLKGCRNLKSLTCIGGDLNPSDFTARGTSLFACLEALEVLSLGYNFGGSCERSLKIFYEMLEAILELKNLKVLSFVWPEHWGEQEAMGGAGELDLSVLAGLPFLSVLSLPQLSDSIEELKGLDRLSQLRILNLEGRSRFFKLPDVGLLPNLQRICVCDCYDAGDHIPQVARFRGIRSDGAVSQYFHFRDHECKWSPFWVIRRLLKYPRMSVHESVL